MLFENLNIHEFGLVTVKTNLACVEQGQPIPNFGRARSKNSEIWSRQFKPTNFWWKRSKKSYHRLFNLRKRTIT